MRCTPSSPALLPEGEGSSQFPSPCGRGARGEGGLLFLAIAALFLLLSCKGNAGQPRRTPLVIWHSYNNEENEIFQKLLDGYRAKNPQIEIKAERVPFEGLLPKLITAAIAGKTPDIARVDLGHIARLAWGKAILPLDVFGADKLLAEMHPIARSVATVRVPKSAAQIFAVPDQLTTVALYYNKDLLRAAGIVVPKNLAELAAAGRAFNARKLEAKAFGMNSSLWWMMPFLYLHNARILSDDLTQCRLADNEGQAALRYLRDLYATHGTEGGAWLAGGINPDQGFVTGRYAMVLSGPWNLKAFRQVNFGVTLVPASSQRKSASNIGGSAMVVFRQSKRAQEAYRFLEYLVSPEVQTMWSRGTGQLSVSRRANAALAATMSAEMKVFLEQLDYAGGRPQLPGYDSLELITGPYLYSALDGSLPIDDALKKACRETESDLLRKMVP